MQFVFLGYDNQGIWNNAAPNALYQVGSRIASVPASLSGQALADAIYQQLGIDPAIDTLKAQWQTIMNQAATRPLATMDITQIYSWIDSNIVDANSRTAFKNLAEELFIVRSQIALIAKALDYLFK